MGKGSTDQSQSFTLNEVKNRNLVIEMLKYEDSLIHGETGQEIYKNPLYKPRVSLLPEYSIHRLVLSKFGFTTSAEDVKNYRSIFRNYYHSPDDYDQEVLSSVTYMRENKCVYYTEPIVNVGDQIPNCPIYESDGITQTTLYDQLGQNFQYAFIGGFSNS